MKTRTEPRPVRDELKEMSRTIIHTERDRCRARPGDTAGDCEHFLPGNARMHDIFGECTATSLRCSAHPLYACPQTCPSFRRRT